MASHRQHEHWSCFHCFSRGELRERGPLKLPEQFPSTVLSCTWTQLTTTGKLKRRGVCYSLTGRGVFSVLIVLQLFQSSGGSQKGFWGNCTHIHAHTPPFSLPTITRSSLKICGRFYGTLSGVMSSQKFSNDGKQLLKSNRLPWRNLWILAGFSTGTETCKEYTRYPIQCFSREAIEETGAAWLSLNHTIAMRWHSELAMEKDLGKSQCITLCITTIAIVAIAIAFSLFDIVHREVHREVHDPYWNRDGAK